MSEAGAWVYLPDGSKLDVAPDATVLSVAESIGPRLARAAVGGAVDKEPVGLTTRVPHGAEVRILTFGDEEGRRIYRHTAAHVLAHAAMQLSRAPSWASAPRSRTGSTTTWSSLSR
jgi:threonyl-tRNA synthetase